jgi:hypothetical protein
MSFPTAQEAIPMLAGLLKPRHAILLLLGLLTAAPLLGDEASQARLKKDVIFLASDECEGRGVGTKGLELAAEYVADQLAKAGLKPAGTKGTFFQPFPFTRGSELDGPATLVLDGPMGQKIALKLGTDFQVSGLSGGGKVSAPIVFAGFGATAKDIGYDDYAGIDVKGKIVLALRRVPRFDNKDMPFDGARTINHATFDNKQTLAAANGAAALILVNDATELKAGDPLVPFQLTARGNANNNLPFVQIRRTLAEEMCESSLGQRLSDIEAGINRDLKPRSAPLKGWKATLSVKVKRNTYPVKNIIGVLEGSGPLAKETIVIGAHYDHLGMGGAGSRSPKEKAIHHGADDNASGTTAMLELARHFGAMKDRQGRRLVFMAFTAEESGLIGSRYYTKNPLFPLKDTVAMVNLDMVGRLRADPKSMKDKLTVEGTGTAKGFDAMIEKLNPGFQLIKKPGGNGPSDHDSFFNQKIPIVFFFTGFHDDYHKPTDTSDKINVAGMDRIVGYAEKIIAQLATDPHRPEYVAVASKFTSSPGAGKGPRLGIMPDYEEDKPGVLVSATSKDGPADKGGVKAGDLIVSIAGRPVTNLTTYMAIMGQQKAGQPLEVSVLRKGQKVQLKLVPQ